MAVTRSFKDLIVYQKAFKTATAVHKTSLSLPKAEQYAMADQMRRASKSICANIAEGFGKQKNSIAEFRRFLYMAEGSANEMIVWIDFCEELSYIDKNQADEWRDAYDHISRMLNKLKASSNNRNNQSTS